MALSKAALCVGRVRLAGHEPIALERRDDGGHGRHADLLGAGEARDANWSGESDDRQRGQPRGAQTRGRVDPADPSEQMDRGGVEPVGERCLGGGGRSCAASHIAV